MVTAGLKTRASVTTQPALPIPAHHRAKTNCLQDASKCRICPVEAAPRERESGAGTHGPIQKRSKSTRESRRPAEPTSEGHGSIRSDKSQPAKHEARR